MSIIINIFNQWNCALLLRYFNSFVCIISGNNVPFSRQCETQREQFGNCKFHCWVSKRQSNRLHRWSTSNSPGAIVRSAWVQHHRYYILRSGRSVVWVQDVAKTIIAPSSSVMWKFQFQI